MSTETADMIITVSHFVQSIALLICAVTLYLTGKNLLAVWRQMLIALWELRGLINTLKCTGVADTRSGGNEINGVVVDDSKAGEA